MRRPEAETKVPVRFVPLDTLLKRSDIVCLHVPETKETFHMIGKRELAMMKPGAVLVNMSRGTVVDEIALTEALSFGGLEGVALDVFENEPLPSDSPLVQFPNVLLSPHMSAHTKEALERTAVEVAIAVKKALSGKPMRYLANPEVLKRTILRR